MAPVTSVVKVLRWWDDPRHRPCPVLVACLLALGAVPRTAAGHGFMTEPKTRAADHLKGDVRGWPIAGLPPRLMRRP